jgi:hypothetical protein
LDFFKVVELFRILDGSSKLTKAIGSASENPTIGADQDAEIPATGSAFHSNTFENEKN